MLQSPPPYVPVVEYVLKALEHPPYMYVAKLAACCTMLFLTRENPELLQELSHKWALRFRQDRAKLIAHIRTRASYCVNTPDGSADLESSDKLVEEDANDGTDGESSSKDTLRNDDSEDEVFGGVRCCEPDRAVEHLLSILNTLVPMYFSWNWHRADYVIQINKEYEAYVREFLLPVCTSLAPEEGIDDEERTPWLLPPHTYLEATQSTASFYSPTSGVPPYPVEKPGNVTELRHGVMQNRGGISPRTRAMNGQPTAIPSEMDGLSFSGVANRFSFTNTSTLRRASEKGAAATGSQQQQQPLMRFSPLHPVAPSTRDANAKNSPKVPDSNGSSSQSFLSLQPLASQASGSTYSVPAMSPNVMTAGAFNGAAVSGLRFLSLATYRDALRHNTRGLVTVFHAKYSARSNEVIEAFQRITSKWLLNPMPTIAVVYAVAEPELSSLYNVAWFPTIVYTPPRSCQAHRRRRAKHASLASRSLYASKASDGHGTAVGAGTRPSLTDRHVFGPQKRHSNPVRRQRQRHQHANSSSSSGAAARPQEHSAAHTAPIASRSHSGSESTLDLLPTAETQFFQDAEVDDEEEGREEVGHETWNEESQDAATPASKRPSALAATEAAAVSAAQAVLPREAGKAAESGLPCPVGATVAAPDDANVHLTPSLASRHNASSSSLPSGVSGLLSATAPMPTTPTELLYGIAVEKTTPVLSCREAEGDRSPSQQKPPQSHPDNNSLDNVSFHSSAENSQFFAGDVAQEQRHQPLLEMVEHDDHIIYPLRGELTVPALVEWIGARGASVPRLGKLKDVSTCLKAIRQEEKFKRYRELHSAVVTLRRLQGLGDASGSGSEFERSPNSRSGGSTAGKSPRPSQPTEQPLFIFLGGGMAAGKTTAVAALARSSWWQGHKDHSVVVNADEFKLPLECELESVAAHQHSTRAAENLLVKAINQGRSIVLDGTMMWKPFVQQVVSMVRNAHLTLFKQGPGYDSKTKLERYFIATKARQPALPFPYKIIFLGITVDVETAVPRGFLRKFSTNRGVPISMQLRSFKMFSENFADYVAMMDETTLYNNNVFVNLEKGELPPVMAECNASTEHKLAIHDEAAFQQFLKQQQINEDADNATQVYPSSPASPEVLPPN